jgi:ribonuclease HI
MAAASPIPVTAVAFVIHTDGKQTHCDSGYEANTTNNRMELRAVKEGLAYLKGLGVKGLRWCCE